MEGLFDTKHPALSLAQNKKALADKRWPLRVYSFASDGNTLVIDYHYFPVHELDLKKTSFTLNEETLDKLKDRYGEEEFFKQYRDCKILVASDLGQDNAAAVTTSLNFFGRDYLKEKQLALLVSSRTLFYLDWKVMDW